MTPGEHLNLHALLLPQRDDKFSRLLGTSEVTYAEEPSQGPALSRTSVSVNFLLLGPEAPAYLVP